MPVYDSKELRSKIDETEFKALFKTKPFVHASAMLINWILIIATIMLCIKFPSVWLYILSVIIIGARMHALAILMHDASHFRFLKSRKWNDLITNVTTMYPIFTSVEKYRNNHLAHHQHLNTEDDPDWVVKQGVYEFEFPKTKTQFLLTVASYFALYRGIMDALWFLKRFGGAEMKKHSGSENMYVKIGFYILMIAGLTYFGGWIYWLIFWIVPYFSTFFMFQYIRSVAEHFGELAYEDLLNSTRTVRTTWFEGFFLAPHNVGYHLEHHLFPGVPFYNLPKLHKLLMEESDYHENAHITKGYTLGLMEELGKVG